MTTTLRYLTTFLLVILSHVLFSQPSNPVRAVNEASIAVGNTTIAIVGATLIDGTGSDPLPNTTVIVEKGVITAVGSKKDTDVPMGAEVVDAQGLTLLPGLIDAHFHLVSDSMPVQLLQRGITSLRDPGAWMETYEPARQMNLPLPRLYLTGPHLDGFPPAYPRNSYVVQDVTEAKRIVERLVDQQASALKVYFRLPLDLIRQVCETAHEVGIPVTAHLEITDARDAINVGLDGIEHITSFGTTLLPLRKAERYRQTMLKDNNFRRPGRYGVWSRLDTSNQRVNDLAKFLVEKQTFVCPTLGAFEYRLSEEKPDTLRHTGFERMLDVTGYLQQQGVRMVVGSHGHIPYADWGWSYQREMELMVESGISPMEVLVGATLENARFFRIEDKLGSVEVGKQADLLLLDANPLEDIRAMYQINRVMLNGKWITP
ncbi:amidohydrolase family protein [Tunicatimonas pelagia]|uniref:amidohydrolase family protein n=1 Tax=Tunicatimonas pelagia TaxID=931531 RepID=UPI002665F881|nr:amidohydrolase family protein [Tunicatimonas pelagia]WKN42609.1 amidohydrolase family protein [Tunicatimonas pelagia]